MIDKKVLRVQVLEDLENLYGAIDGKSEKEFTYRTALSLVIEGSNLRVVIYDNNRNDSVQGMTVVGSGNEVNVVPCPSAPKPPEKAPPEHSVITLAVFR